MEAKRRPVQVTKVSQPAVARRPDGIGIKARSPLKLKYEEEMG